MDTLDGLKTIVGVVETSSFTAASERLGISKALVSKYVGEVEADLGTRLFNRTTRQVSATQAGMAYYEQALILLEQYQVMLDKVHLDHSEPSGLIRISAPVTYGEQTLSALVSRFLQKYPKIKVDIKLTNGPVDMLEEGIDVRIRIGEIEDSNMVAKKLSHHTLILCASKSYLETKGQPETIEQLKHHNCVLDSNFKMAHLWPFKHISGEITQVSINSNFSVNSPKAVQKAVLSGAGIGLIPDFIIEDDLNAARLIHLLPNYQVMSFGLYAVYPHRKYLAQKIRCFLDFISDFHKLNPSHVDGQ